MISITLKSNSMKLFSTFILVTSFFTIFSQSNWHIIGQTCIGGNGNEVVFGTLKLSNGLNLIYGKSKSGISGDKTEVNFGMSDYWVVAIDDSMHILWQKTLGGNNEEFLYKVIESSEHYLYLIGYSSSGSSGNKTAQNYGGQDVWLVKLDLNGNIIWDKSFGGLLNDEGFDIAELESGNLILSNTSNSDISGNKNSLNKGANDLWFLKINKNGNILVDKSIGGNNNDGAGKISILNNSELIINGYSNSPISGDKSQENFGDFDYWILKIDSSGILLKDLTLGGNAFDFDVKRESILFNDNYYLFASSSSPISGNKTVSNYLNSTDCWIVKLDLSLNILNQVSIGSDSSEMPTSVIYIDNKFIVGSVSYSNVNQFKTENNKGKGDNWFFSLDENFNFISDKSFGSSNDENYTFIESLSNGELLIATYSNGTANNDKTCLGHNTSNLSNSPTDFWIYKLSTDAGISNIKNENFVILPNPTKDLLYVKTENYVSSISILNIDGKIISEKNVENFDYSVNTTGLLIGIYLCKIVDINGKVYIQKFVKE